MGKTQPWCRTPGRGVGVTVEVCSINPPRKVTTMSTQARKSANRALIIKRTLGVRKAAGYLRNKGVSLEEALYILRHNG